jgi:hypothetical protein
MRRFVIEDALRGNDRKPTDIICFLSTKFPPTPRLLDSYFFALCSCFSRQKTFEIIIETLSTLLFFFASTCPGWMDGEPPYIIFDSSYRSWSPANAFWRDPTCPTLIEPV